jgi:hypothetical protein
MFAPKMAKAPDSPTLKLAPQPSTLVARPVADGAVEQAQMLQGTIGNQATLRYLAHRLSNLPAEGPAEWQEQEAASENMTAREASRSPSWDFSKIPVFPPDQTDHSQPSSPLAATTLPGAIQAKLVVEQVNDPLEHEADRVADQVMRMATPPAADDGPAIRSAGPRIQRKCAACGAEPCTCVQRKAESAPLAAISDHAPSVLRTGGQPSAPRDAPRSVAAALAGPGRQLDSPARSFFESRLGVDLGTVRVHDHPHAAASAQELAARAYTVGSDIVFAAGRYQPATTAGRELLAHELAHVFQQEHRPHAVQRKAEPATDPRIVVTPTKEGVNITITADTKLEGSEVYVLAVMYGKRVSRERAIKLIENGEDVGCVASVCKTGMQPGETIDLFFGPDQRRQQEHVQAPKRKLPPEVQNALESGYMRIFMLDRQTQKHLELPAQPDFSEDRAVIMARNALLVFSHDDIGCFWRWLAGEKIEGWWNLAYRLGQFLEVRPNVCAPVDLMPLGRLSGHEDIYALIKETEKLEQQTFTQAGRYDHELHEKLDSARAARDKALRDADFPDVGAFDTAANEFRVYFRTVAVAVLEHSLDQTEHVLRDAVGRYQVGSNSHIKPGDQINPVAQQLYDELYRLPNSQARSRDQLLIDHPILQGVTVWNTISRAENVLDFSNRLTLYALERLNIDLPMVRNALGRSQDVVFKFDPIVTATMERIGVAPESIFTSVIQDQRGKPGDPWWQKVLDVGLLLLSFVPGPIGIVARTVSAIRDIGGAVIEYDEQYSAYEVGYQDKPSVAPIAISVGANVLPGAAVAGVGKVAGKAYRTVKALRAASSLETAAVRTAATDIVKTEAGDVARTEGDVLVTDLARTEGEAAKDVATAEGEAAKDVAKTEGEAVKDVGKTEGEAAKDVAKTEGEAAKDVAKTEGEAAKDVAKTEGEAAKDVAKTEGEAAKDVGILGADEPQVLSLDELRQQRDALALQKSQLEEAARRKEAELEKLRETVEARKAEQAEKGVSRRLKGEDRIEKLQQELNNDRQRIGDVDRQLSETSEHIRSMEGPKPPQPKPPSAAAPAPELPIGELDIPANPVSLAGTKMQSWNQQVYIATSTSGYRPNVEKLLLKNEDGPLSKALLMDKPGGGKMIREYPDSVTREFADQNRDLFLAGHLKSAKTGDRNVIVLTSAYRNMEYAGTLEITGNRFADFAYNIQGIAVEARTAWDLVAANKLAASELTDAKKIWLAK